ncbi:hypothetical protein K458DRAFT_409265 [Lentithecium fluviatile CBS 122367]|uniref:Uncharacterized protein n=1 Tax=Lentithecium fluviatile CBS 122367 TaxID=1168545 RepID=A0A6G1II66_9PLEO|nr:hypothetical protein K458DRAFT_409265 [Lentithecium fluviatile CBS 122367]
MSSGSEGSSSITRVQPVSENLAEPNDDLRNTIYQYFLADTPMHYTVTYYAYHCSPTENWEQKHPSRPYLGLMQVNKLLRAEFRPLFYANHCPCHRFCEAGSISHHLFPTRHPIVAEDHCNDEGHSLQATTRPYRKPRPTATGGLVGASFRVTNPGNKKLLWIVVDYKRKVRAFKTARSVEVAPETLRKPSRPNDPLGYLPKYRHLIDYGSIVGRKLYKYNSNHNMCGSSLTIVQRTIIVLTLGPSLEVEYGLPACKKVLVEFAGCLELHRLPSVEVICKTKEGVWAASGVNGP